MSCPVLHDHPLWPFSIHATSAVHQPYLSPTQPASIVIGNDCNQACFKAEMQLRLCTCWVVLHTPQQICAWTIFINARTSVYAPHAMHMLEKFAYTSAHAHVIPMNARTWVYASTVPMNTTVFINNYAYAISKTFILMSPTVCALHLVKCWGQGREHKFRWCWW